MKKTIKLTEWCEKTGIKYLTAWRWFNNNKMPVQTYKTIDGTILVEDDEDFTQEILNNDSEPGMISINSVNNAMSLFLKKTVEYSKNEASVEDFAAYVISNFQLKLNNSVEVPKYSKNKPAPEKAQEHIKQFLPSKEVQKQLKLIKESIINNKLEDVIALNEAVNAVVEEPLLMTDEHLNYINKYKAISGDISMNHIIPIVESFLEEKMTSIKPVGQPFQPTQQELLSATKIVETAEQENMPKKRGRKSIKKDV
jgi:hypothetical protein